MAHTDDFVVVLKSWTDTDGAVVPIHSCDVPTPRQKDSMIDLRQKFEERGLIPLPTEPLYV